MNEVFASIFNVTKTENYFFSLGSLFGRKYKFCVDT